MQSTKTIDQMTPEEIREVLQKKEAEAQKELQKKEKQFQSEKDDFIVHTASKFKQVHNELAELKEHMMVEANKLYERMYEVKGKDPREVNSFSLKNQDDTIKITVDRQERFEFTDDAIVHINAIKEIFKQKFAQRNKGLYKILDGLLIKGTQGDYDPRLLAKARRQVRELGDQKLIEEFDRLDECQRVSSTSNYGRCHVRDKKGQWKEITLNFSRM